MERTKEIAFIEKGEHMDIKRVTSTLLGFPLVVIMLTFGNKYVVDIFLAVVALIAMQEYFNAVSKDSKLWVKWI